MNDFTPGTQNRKLQYMQATGDLPHPLTNDYMFKALLQKNENALKHLICSLLHLRPERSLSYLCRNYDQLSRGEDYINVKPAIHIGFLDFVLFPYHPEFYATYKMMNVKNHHIFTDKFGPPSSKPPHGRN